MRSDVESCLNMMNVESHFVRIIVFVDDLISACNDELLLCEVKKMLHDRFKMVDLGNVSWFLGVEFERGRDFIDMNHKLYLRNLLGNMASKNANL